MLDSARRQLRDLAIHDFVPWDEARNVADDIDALREDIVRKWSRIGAAGHR